MKTFKVNLIVTTPDVFNTRTIYSSVLEATHDTFEDNSVIVNQIDVQDLSTDYVTQLKVERTLWNQLVVSFHIALKRCLQLSC